MNALAPIVSALALANEAVLLWIDEHGAPETKAALAAALDRDPSNLGKSLGLLMGEGLLNDALDLTGDGFDTVQALKRMRGENGQRRVMIGLIDANPDNPRKVYDDDSLVELAQSIADKGLLQPMLVRPKGERFELVIGERRWRASQMAMREGWVPADFDVPVDVRLLSDDAAFEMMGVENLQREDLHWMDEAEFYAKLAARGRSGADIERICGRRKKRSIQEYIQFANELSPADKARCRLPKGHPQGLAVEQCRAMVGEKKEKTPLDLTPPLATALVELLHASEEQGHPVTGSERTVQLFTPPTGGPILRLANERKLLRFAFNGPQLFIKIPVTEEVARFLNQVGFDADRDACLLKLRTASIGELSAGAVRAGEYVTAELNEPEAPPVVETVTPPAAQAPAPDATPAPAPAAPAPRPAPDVDLQLIIVELAHKLARDGLDRGSWQVEIDPTYYKDAKAQHMVMERLAAFMPHGPKTMATLTTRAQEWLDEEGYSRIPDGRSNVTDDGLILFFTARSLGAPEIGDYLTPWLKLPQPAPAAAAPAGPPPAPDGAAAPPLAAAPTSPAPAPAPTPSFAHQVAHVTGEGKAMAALAHAVREGNTLLMAAKTRKLSTPEIDQRISLSEAALEQAAKYLEA